MHLPLLYVLQQASNLLHLPQWVRSHGVEPPIVVFVKHFDVSHQTLAGLGHFYVHRHMRVMDLALMINERLGYPATTPLKIYEVRRATRDEGAGGELTLPFFPACRRSSRT